MVELLRQELQKGTRLYHCNGDILAIDIRSDMQNGILLDTKRVTEWQHTEDKKTGRNVIWEVLKLL
jgi:hypothetical protein